MVTEKIGTHSLQGFANYAKTYLLQKYEDTCTILNCYQIADLISNTYMNARLLSIIINIT